MRRVYRNPPLIEALCEFEFQAGQPWDWTVPGRIYERVRREYPLKRELHALELDVRTEGTAAPQEAIGGVARMLFLREDERAALQVGPDVLAVNQLKPYTDWQSFRAMIERALAVYVEVAQPEQTARIGLRYINRIELPSLSEAGRYVLFLPQTPEAISHAPESWAMRVNIPDGAQEYLRLQSAALVDAPAIVLDIEFATEQPYHPQRNDWLQWLERAHTQIVQVFEASITPVAREAFGEEVNHE